MEKVPLTKSDLCWVIVKFVGVFFLFQAVMTLAGSLGLAIKADDGEIFFKGFLASIVPLLIGGYLLFSGAFLHGWLMAVPLGFRAKPVGGDSLAEKRLSADEYESYLKWLEGNEEIARRDEFDQLALFRDAQKRGEV